MSIYISIFIDLSIYLSIYLYLYLYLYLSLCIYIYIYIYIYNVYRVIIIEYLVYFYDFCYGKLKLNTLNDKEKND